MTTGVNKPIWYNSIFHHLVDDKRRVQIPHKWRPADPEVEFTLVLWPNRELQEACLFVFPPDAWIRTMNMIVNLPYVDDESQSLRRLVGGYSAQVGLDKAGRICIPEEMAKKASIGKEAVLHGMLDAFQIWDPQRHEQAFASDKHYSGNAYKLLNRQPQ
jgi:MraZ protein